MHEYRLVVGTGAMEFEANLKQAVFDGWHLDPNQNLVAVACAVAYYGTTPVGQSIAYSLLVWRGGAAMKI